MKTFYFLIFLAFTRKLRNMENMIKLIYYNLFFGIFLFDQTKLGIIPHVSF